MAFNAATRDAGIYQTLFPPANQNFPVEKINFPSDLSALDGRARATAPSFSDGSLFSNGLDAGRTTIAPKANETVTYHYTTKVKDKKEIARVEEDNIGKIVFAHTGRVESLHDPGFKGKYEIEMYTLKGVNAFLEKKSENYATVAQVLKDWKFLGVVKNEVMRHANATRHRMFNLAVKGRVLASNEWKADEVFVDSRLYLVLERYQGHWRFVPRINVFAHTKDDVDLENTEFIYVGRAAAVPSCGSRDPSKGLLFSENVEIHVRV